MKTMIDKHEALRKLRNADVSKFLPDDITAGINAGLKIAEKIIEGVPGETVAESEEEQ